MTDKSAQMQDRSQSVSPGAGFYERPKDKVKPESEATRLLWVYLTLPNTHKGITGASPDLGVSLVPFLLGCNTRAGATSGRKGLFWFLVLGHASEHGGDVRWSH